MQINIQMTREDYNNHEQYFEQMSLDLSAFITITDINTGELIMMLDGLSI